MSQIIAFNDVKKNEEFIFYVTLTHPTDADVVVTNPTLAAGDAKVSTDGAAFANPGTLPAVTPAGGRGVKVTLSAGEMNGDNVLLILTDQTAPEEWQTLTVSIRTKAVDIDDLVRSATPANALAVDASGRLDLGKWAGTTVSLDSGTSLPDVHFDAIGGSTAKATALAAAIDTGSNLVLVDVSRLSGDATAADNA